MDNNFFILKINKMIDWNYKDKNEKIKICSNK